MLVKFYPPPIHGSAAASPGSSSEYLRRAWISGAWRRASLSLKGIYVAAILAWWPSTMVMATYLAIKLGPSRQRLSGKTPFLQFVEQLSVAGKWMVPPKWYYIFEFFDDERRAHAGEYLQRVQTKPFILNWLVDSVNRKSSRFPFANKAYFHALCRQHGLPTAEVIAVADKQLSFYQPEMEHLPFTDLFVKIRKGRGGRGAEKWSWDGERYRGAAGKRLTEPELRRYILRRSWIEGRVIQTCLRNHPALSDLNLNALATLRVMTIRDGSGGVEVTHAVFRMPQVVGIAVDNFHAGGLAAPVDLETGKLGRASDIGVSVQSRWHDVHPVTGAQIEGRILPHWRAVLDLASRAHLAIGDRVVVGWDIAILEHGPCLVEGNGRPDLDIIQRQHRVGLGETRFGQLLAHHLRARLAGSPSDGRPTRQDSPRSVRAA